MHELSVCQSLIQQVEAVAREHGARHVYSVLIGVGALSGVEPMLLEQAYTIASAGTIAEDSDLIIEEMPVRVHCDTCDSDSDVSANRLICKFCGDWKTRLISGDELFLNRIELSPPGKGPH